MFKVGDRVRIVNPYEIDAKYKNQIVTIIKVDEYDLNRYFVKENLRPWRGRELELVEEYKMKKADLKNNDIVTLRNGDRLVYARESFKDLNDNFSNPISSKGNINEDLTYYMGENEYDIVKVERPVKYETVFEREEVQELTVDEISERLGYKVKVVGEDR